MTKIKTNSLHLFISLFVIVFGTPSVFAEKIKVTKVKGKQAIIETSALLEEGQTYELLTQDKISEDVDYKSNVTKSRKNSLSLGGQLSFLNSTTYQSNSYSFQGRYGWNFSNLELGGVLDFSSVDLGAGATSNVMAGGYFDYNFIPNRDPKKTIYGMFALIGFGSKSASGGSSSLIEADFGGFISYFIANSSTALRAELYGVYQQVNTTTSQGSLAGFGGRALLQFYF